MELNKIYNMDWLDNNISDNSAQLIIADPPYYEIKGDFDFIWDSFEDYLKDVERWVIECKRIIADNGTLFWWGYSKTIAYSQIILDKYFNLENSLIWRKIDSMQYQYYSPDSARSFNTHNERLLMYSNEIKMTGLEMVIEKFIKPHNPVAKYLRDEFKRAGVNNKEIAKLFPSRTGGLTGCVSNWLNGDNVITKEQYLLIRGYLNNEYLRREYEDLRREYEDKRRPFNNYLKLEDILEFSQASNISKQYDHETVKPEKLTRSLILTCSHENDLIIAPFAGSGTECAMALKEGRNYIGFDIYEKYVKIATDRCDLIKQTPKLFQS